MSDLDWKNWNIADYVAASSRRTAKHVTHLRITFAVILIICILVIASAK